MAHCPEYTWNLGRMHLIWLTLGMASAGAVGKSMGAMAASAKPVTNKSNLDFATLFIKNSKPTQHILFHTTHVPHMYSLCTHVLQSIIASDEKLWN